MMTSPVLNFIRCSGTILDIDVLMSSGVICDVPESRRSANIGNADPVWCTHPLSLIYDMPKPSVIMPLVCILVRVGVFMNVQ